MSENIWECPHANRTDWGSGSCKLYDPYITDPKKQLVQYGTCDSNENCIYKQYMELSKRLKDLDKIQNGV